MVTSQSVRKAYWRKPFTVLPRTRTDSQPGTPLLNSGMRFQRLSISSGSTASSFWWSRTRNSAPASSFSLHSLVTVEISKFCKTSAAGDVPGSTMAGVIGCIANPVEPDPILLCKHWRHQVRRQSTSR